MIYKIRFLSGENEAFVRDIEIEDNKTFLDLHLAIQNTLGFDSNMLASFFMTTDCWQKGQEITLEKMEDDKLAMKETLLKSFIDKEKQKLLYVFDYFNERALFAEIVYMGEAQKDMVYPACTRNEGDAPPQFVEPES